MTSLCNPQPPSVQPVALTIGGSDSGGGAGIQADLKTFTALGVHGCSAISCVTAQNTLGVSRVDALPPEALTAQVAAVVSDLPVAALKTGMLFNQALIEAAVTALAQLAAEPEPRVPEARVPKAPVPAALAKVVDPVMVSRARAVLLEGEAIATIRTELLPLADLITPNIHEARLLSGLEIDSAAAMERAAERLAGLGPAAVLIKGAGLQGLKGVDLLWWNGQIEWLRSSPIDTPHTHGSGCTLSAAITAHLARGWELRSAIRAAKTYVEAGLRHSLAIGSGPGPLCHWHSLLKEDADTVQYGVSRNFV